MPAAPFFLMLSSLASGLSLGSGTRLKDACSTCTHTGVVDGELRRRRVLQLLSPLLHCLPLKQRCSSILNPLPALVGSDSLLAAANPSSPADQPLSPSIGSLVRISSFLSLLSDILSREIFAASTRTDTSCHRSRVCCHRLADSFHPTSIH